MTTIKPENRSLLTQGPDKDDFESWGPCIKCTLIGVLNDFESAKSHDVKSKQDLITPLVIYEIA